MTTQPATPAPAVGQIWQDNDPRTPDRYLWIAAIDATHATVQQVTRSTYGWPVVAGARSTRIRLNRFRPTSTGYRYVTTAEDGAR